MPFTDSGLNVNPLIYGDWVAWESKGSTMSSISVESLTNRCRIDIPVDFVESFDISQDRICYADYRDENFDVYTYSIGAPETPFNASFSTNVTIGEPPLVVGFEDTSLGEPEGWFWDFGDGQNSTEENPVHTYTEPGRYTVTLWIHDLANRDAIQKVGLISVGSEPVAHFSSDIEWGPGPLTVEFKDGSTGQPDSWFWDFGDDQNSSEQNPTHIYANPSAYNVSLIVRNTFGMKYIFKSIQNNCSSGHQKYIRFSYSWY